MGSADGLQQSLPVVDPDALFRIVWAGQNLVHPLERMIPMRPIVNKIAFTIDNEISKPPAAIDILSGATNLTWDSPRRPRRPDRWRFDRAILRGNLAQLTLEGITVGHQAKRHSFDAIYQRQQKAARRLINSGPLSACFTVYSDFFSYTAGIQSRVTGDCSGGHCVFIVGLDDNRGFWKCKDS